MVFFVVTRAGRHVLDKYLASWGGRFMDRVAVVTYGALRRRRSLPAGLWVLADLERLSPAGRREAVGLCERLSRDPERHRVLNDPARALGRFELLRALHDEGVNAFRAHRLSKWDGTARYPVFLRSESDHVGPRTPLLWDAREVDRTLDDLRWRGVDLEPWLAVEFEDCADDAGLYRKYSSFLIDGRLLPRHVFFSQRWVQKWADLRGGSWSEEELAYVREGPHASRLLPIFERAGIEYGRIDYSIGKSGLQVWEINTNPIILDPFDHDDPTRLEAHTTFAASWDRTLDALCSHAPAGPGPRATDRWLGRAHVAAEAAKETRVGRRVRRWKHRAANALHGRVACSLPPTFGRGPARPSSATRGIAHD